RTRVSASSSTSAVCASDDFNYSFPHSLLFYFLTGAAPPAIYTLSLHDALPIFAEAEKGHEKVAAKLTDKILSPDVRDKEDETRRDRKSTRLNSSHVKISYAVFCLKKKKKERQHHHSKKTHQERRKVQRLIQDKS